MIFFFLAPVGLLGVRKISKLVLRRAVARGMIGRRDIVLIGDPLELSVLEPRDLLAFFGAGDVNRFILSKEEDPLERQSNDIRVVNSVANFVRERNAREILLAVPWTDSARIEFIREHIKIAAGIGAVAAGHARAIADGLFIVCASKHHVGRNSGRAAQLGSSRASSA